MPHLPALPNARTCTVSSSRRSTILPACVKSSPSSTALNSTEREIALYSAHGAESGRRVQFHRGDKARKLLTRHPRSTAQKVSLLLCIIKHCCVPKKGNDCAA
mmetsp:Transcript_20246/g.26822  ORF Transcript_20246/g.26822 Transcript_20246/m.26822 type:complete len:103 (-) Transcript_20246:164-472(-)